MHLRNIGAAVLMALLLVINPSIGQAKPNHPVMPVMHHQHHVITDQNASVHIRNYHVTKYHTTVNVKFVENPRAFPGRYEELNEHRYYCGYWCQYWRDERWEFFQNQIGFFIFLDGESVFVYENEPGECEYWDGYEFVPWYNQPFAPYGCPY